MITFIKSLFGVGVGGGGGGLKMDINLFRVDFQDQNGKG